MKRRFGIRGKITAYTFVLVLAGTVFLLISLMKATTQQVVEHELVDLKDETDLRCWEFIHSVNLVRKEAGDSSKDEKRFQTLVSFLGEDSEALPNAQWWKEILVIRQIAMDGSDIEAPVISTKELGMEIPPIPEHTMKAARDSGAPVVSPLLSVKTRLGISDVPRLREPVVWAVCRKDSDPDVGIALLLRLYRSTDPRHLSILWDGKDFLQHPDPVKVPEEDPGPPTFQSFDFPKQIAKLDKGKRWSNSNQSWSVQRGEIRKTPLSDRRYFYLEGKATEALIEKMREEAEVDFNKVKLWNRDVGNEFRDLEVRISGAPIPTDATTHYPFRLLARSGESVDKAKERVESVYKKKFGVSDPVRWYPKAIKAKQADIQLTRFYLGLSEEERPGGASAPDPPYYFGYATMREELAFNTRREFNSLFIKGVWVAVISGLVAFGVAFLFLRPLYAITNSAKQVTAKNNESSPLQHQLEAVRSSLPVHQNDEVGDIARALENLLRQIINGHETLRQLNADLDNRVKEQTGDLRKANKELMGLTTAKDEFLASVSHELRQPLNSIFGYLQFLETSDLDEQQSQDALRIRQAASYLLALINDILDYQKIIMGGLELEPCEFHGGEFLEELRKSMIPQAGENKNTLVFKGTGKVGMLFNDPDRLRQILTNLIANACKFTENGKVSLVASLDDGMLTLDVIDTGRGLEPEEQQQLFEKFKKLATRHGNKSGTGLGLVITKGLCELMGGVIDCESKFGKGSKFSVTIPSRIKAPEFELAVSRDVVRPASAPEKNSRARDLSAAESQPLVLVIDDDDAVLDLMTRFLEKNNYRVICASDGNSGFELALEALPSVITLDVVLPDADGWEILSRFKSDPRTVDIPVMMVTFKEEQAQGFSLGAAEYLVKPIEWDLLIKKLRNLTSGPDEDLLVLVVDDDQGTRVLFRRMLEKNGMKVVEAANGNEAVERMEEQLPSIVLLDLMMPEADGFDFIDVYRGRPEWGNVPIMVVTAKDTTPQEREWLNGCVDAILQKGGAQRENLLADILHFVQQNARSLHAEQMELK